ncbi:MAG: hypothetical protein KDD49_02350 [Bacteroidetes bacterium]|nr:hypothetical protein [Bacteroidota bacterium]MCB9043482.1 hypothetical protein [Chitinophagales bacterium]
MFSKKNNTLSWFLWTVLLLVVGLSACKKDNFYDGSDAQVNLSTDTLTFDTVFTTLGSTLNGFLIHNPYKKPVQISNIQLAGGNSSSFRLNVDGVASNSVDAVEINAKDSLYVFVEVTIDPNEDQLPFVIEDSILITTNGNLQKVYLNAWGQNAHFLRDEEAFFWETCDQILTDDLPWVVFGALYVPPDCTLEIQEGTDIYFHPKNTQLATLAGIWVEGNLQINGKADSLVHLQGVRLEEYYDDLAAQWGAVHLLRGSTANINFAEIKNNVWGITVGKTLDTTCTVITTDNMPQVTINNTLIKNCLLQGMEAILANVQMNNCLMYNAGENILRLQYGGNYDFNQCNFVNYGQLLNHRDPVLLATNFLVCYESGVETVFPAIIPTHTHFTNCILHGYLEDELTFADEEITAGGVIDWKMTNCIVKTDLEQTDERFVNCIFNPIATDTLFVDRSEFDFHLHQLSPAVDAGVATEITTDLDNQVRNSPPDIGCYEYVQ